MSEPNREVVEALRAALKERDRLRKENGRLLSGASNEPIAILGMSCRYPGEVGSPQELWRLVSEGADAIGGFPADRGWELERLYDPDPDAPGTSYAREGGFLADAGDFDAAFFGISPREAVAMDPQQRLLLEAAWEALEDAGLDPGALRGSPTGVFAGVSSQDYQLAQVASGAGEGSLATGGLLSVISGRVAYTLGLEGPAMTIDTACSSSLVAIHLAAQALRGGECGLALAGGVTVLATPGAFIEFSRQRGLAPDGRCKAFADAADGTGFSEGVGVLALERLSDAQRNGHPVLAVIKGSAVNQDGASNGLSAPNGPSQERVIRQALANARLTPQDVDAVEAHGTGTTLGDPIEAGALLATYGQERETPLRLGTIKSNIGHTQAAAGVAGVIKTVMAMREGVLPKTLHVDAPSSKVDWEAGEVELLTEAEPWEPNGQPRRAGVSSFGISGTNAHVILEEGPSSPLRGGGTDPGASSGEPALPGPIPLVLSAKSEPALAAQARRLAAHLKASPELDPTDVAYSLATTRAALEHRAVALGADREQLLGALSALAEGKEDPRLTKGIARAGQRPAFLFAGQGAQHARMAGGLLDSSPAFARRIEECEQALSPFVDWSLREVLREEEGEWLSRLDVVQPALFAVMVSLAGLWRECGARPAVVAGHSQGEIAAAHVAGGLSLEDAAKIIALRGKAMAKIAGQGGMLSVSLPAAELEGRLEAFGERLSLAAINGPASLVVSGEPEALGELQGALEQDDIRTQSIAVDYAAHSAQIEALKAELLEAFASISPQSGEIGFHSTVTGELLDTAELGPEYWYRNLRQTVLLEPVLRSMLAQGRRAFIEIGPHPVLGFGLRETIADALGSEEGVAVIDSLRREEGGAERFCLSLAQAHSQGVELDWESFFKGTAAKAVKLPTYPFQRERYWVSATGGPTDAGSLGQGNPAHPLLSAVIEDPQGEGLTLTGRLSLQSHPWLSEHAVAGTVLFPGTGFLELALRAAEEVGAESVGELTLQAPLILAEQGATQIQVSVEEPDEQGNRPISIHSRPESAEEAEAGEWTCHAQGMLSSRAAAAAEPIAGWPPEGAEALDVSDLYERLADLGFEYGPAFQGVQSAWQVGETIYAEVSLDEEHAEGAQGFGIHPALLDAALHAAFLGTDIEGQAPKLPFAFSEVSLHAEGAARLRAAITPTAQSGISLALFDMSGAPLAGVGSLALRELDPGALQGTRAKDGLLEVRWSEVSLPEPLAAESEPELWHCKPDPEQDPAEAARALTAQALTALQAHLGAEDSTAVLAIITEGAICAGEGESADPAQAALWGLVRSAQSEHPGRFLLLDSDGTEASLEALPAALALGDQEPQLALREGVALVPRAAYLQDRGDWLLPPAGPWRLDAPTSGTIEGLELVPNSQALEPLGPTGVRVAMRAAGLNFRDVLVALGFTVPGQGVIGGEGAGVVVEVGEEVSDLAPGDRVMGQMAHAFAPLALSDRDLLTSVPDGWSFEQAAAVPSVFSTAYYGLVELADLQPGQKVLIHAGAGGVGIAATQLAHHLGAEVFATASPAKWEVLREAGIAEDHIASSRELDFKQKFLELTDGEGVDVVLNSLAGEFIDASLELLPRGGRFLEMGKTDIRDAEQVAAGHPGVSYRAFDLTVVEPRRVQQMLVEVTDLLERGALQHSPRSEWDVRRAREAFRHLREGKNVGKVVLTIPRPIDPKATVLITGATGVLGSLVARRLLSEHGARNLLLASRRGEKAEGAKELQAELEGLGAKVTIAACDVADKEQLQELLDSIPAEHPLGAVIHAAGALDDATIESLSPERLEAVFAPKADAAWALHELTKEADLSAFVLFSSLAGTLGGPGQGNYAAANSFLDALALRRQSEGLPATSIAWGFWQSASAMTAHLEQADLARMRRAGIVALSDEQGLELFDQALLAEVPLSLAVPLERAALRAQASAGVLPAILSGLIRLPARRRQASTGSLAVKLADLPEAEHEAFVTELVRAEAAAVLGHDSSAAIEPEKAFKDLGFDSLAAVELRNRLGAASGLQLAPTIVFDYPNAAALAGYLLSEVSAEPSARKVAVKAQATDEPIAILGMSCRYPGEVGSPEALWELVSAGTDAIGGFPADRGWELERLYDPDPDAPGTSYAREGGFLADAGDFDAAFFGISPREAVAMDPQQRLLLEAAWEALEDAGIDPGALRGSPTGVFAGVSSQDYQLAQVASGAGEGSLATGGLLSVISGRVAYTLGLEGPAMTIDTACSSSLVAIHLAAQALRGGECGLALAGGVTVLATPGGFIEFSRQRGLAPDGRCKSFADAADGTGLSEGVGVLALERLSDAQRNGHPVLAVIKGSAVNQDGASNGLSAPNGPSQERVIRQALANARLTPQDVDAVEAHGTGTTLGDPIEAGALLATYGQERETPLRLGTIKSNIGHTQAAAGVAGVIKTVMAMREGVLPKTLHVDAPSSKVDWEAGEVELLTEAEPWEPNGQPRRAGVSSFGISGTNAHVILEEGPSSPLRGGGTDPGASSGEPALPGPIPLVLSAKSEPALAAQARRLAAHLKASPELDPTDVAYSLATTRAALEHRAVALGADREQLLGALSALAEGKEDPRLTKGIARAGQRPAFLFAGQGAQHARMAGGLLDSSPAFARRIEECEQALSPFVDWSLREVLREEEGEWLSRLDVVQPALFAVMVSLAGLWRECGARPAVVAGHSQGEIAAAHVAGGLSLEDAAKIIALRGKAMAKIAGQGGMLSVSLPAAELEGRLEAFGERLSLAAINGPASLVVSGEPEALGELQGALEQDDIRTQSIAVDYAAHSAQIEALKAELLEAFASISPQSGEIGFHSTVTGELLDTAELGPEYWYRNLRQTVLLEPVLRSMLAQGRRAFIEIGPHPVLGFGLRETIADALGSEEGVAVIDSLRREEGGAERFCLSLAQAHSQGVELDWESFFKGTAAKAVKLPTYPFQRERYWVSATGGPTDAGSLGQGNPAHPLLSAVIEDPQGEGLTLTGRLSLQSHPWLSEHAVAGTVLFPGTGFLELALRAAEEVGAESVGELTLQAPLILAEQGATQIQVSVEEPDEQGNRPISIHSRPESAEEAEAGEWTCHAQGMLSSRAAAAAEPIAGWPPEGAEALDVSDLYERFAELGLDYGPTFQGVTAAWRGGETIYAEVSLEEEQAHEAERFGIHPALLDAALHASLLGALAMGGEDELQAKLPFAWREVSLQSTGAGALRVRLEGEGEGLSLSLADVNGMAVGRVGSLVLRSFDAKQIQAAGRAKDGLLEVGWIEVPLPQATAGLEFERWHCEPDAGDDRASAARAATEEALAAMRAHLAAEEAAPVLAVLTRGALAAREGESADPAAAAVWGLVRSAQSEYPGRFVLIDSDGTQASLDALAATLSIEAEPQLALRDGVALAPRVGRVSAPPAGEARGQAFDPERTVLITGGTGGIGAMVARHLASEHGVHHLLLASRRGDQAEGAAELADELERLGAVVRIAACDVSDRRQLENLIAAVPAEHPLGAVIHAAGVIGDATIETLEAERIGRVFAPKVDAAWHLHELTAELSLTAFVLFSSGAGVLGSPGQGGYAAASVFLDALAARRRAEGLPATAIAWGQWETATGMTAHLSEVDLLRLRRLGIEPISDEQGLTLFDAALAIDRALILAMRLNPAGLRTLASAGALPAILRGLVRIPNRRQASAGSLAAELAGLPAHEREGHVLELVRGEAAVVLGYPSAEGIDANKAFMDLGFDSLAAIEMRSRLGVRTGIELPVTLVFDYPNSAALAGYLIDQVDQGGRATVDLELNQLKLSLAAIPAEDPRRANLAAHLRALAADLESSGQGEARATDVDRLEEASDEELLDFIDEQVGSS